MNIVWKSFKLGTIFNYSGKHVIKTPIKRLNTYKTYQNGLIANATSTKNNNGINCYVELNNEIENKKIKNVLTIATNGSVGVSFYHPYYIISTGDNKVLEIYNLKLKKIFDENEFLYYFFAKLLTKLFYNTYYSYTKKIKKEDVDDTIVLLPCVETFNGVENIWEENNRYYTLAVDYIKYLMDSAKELKQEKTIKLYEAKRAKYEAAYFLECSLLGWKSFSLDYFFEISTNHVIEPSLKQLKTYDTYEEGLIANITATKENNGVKCYISLNDEIEQKKKKSVLTIAPDAEYAGVCFYHPYYIVSTGHNKLIEFKEAKTKNLFESNNYLYYFLSKILTKNFCKTFYGFNKSITQNDFKDTVVILPCIMAPNNENTIFKENTQSFTLATNYISYLYLTGRINKYQKLIDEYTYKLGV